MSTSSPVSPPPPTTAAQGGDAAGPPGGQRPQRATIIDVAEAAGVSRQTVTRAMNDMRGISPATRERVLAVAERLDYRPSRFGRGLVTGGDRQLGLILNDLRNPYSPELAAAVVAAAAASGWNVMLADVGLAGDSDRSVDALGAQADVVVGYFGDRAAQWFQRLGKVPVVELDPAGPVTRAAVHIDPADAIEELADHLVAAGVRRPVVLDASAPGVPSRRGTLLVRAFERRGLAAGLVHGSSTAASGAEETRRLLAGSARPDAVCAFNDLMALGVLSACRRAGVDVPGGVRVIGMDGLPLGELVAPTLSTLAVDLDAVAREALDLARSMLSGALPRSGKAVQRTVRHRLLLRESA